MNRLETRSIRVRWLARCVPGSHLRNPLMAPLNLDPLGANPKIEEQFDEAACVAERSFRPAVYRDPDADLADWSVHDCNDPPLSIDPISVCTALHTSAV